MLRSRHYDGAVLIAPESEWNYVQEYLSSFPEEHFLFFTYEEMCAQFEFDLADNPAAILRERDVPESFLPYLVKMTQGPYKDPKLQELQGTVDRLLEKGVFLRKKDPALTFCGKPIILRGYYSGKMIAEALQDLPNIALNWDLGGPRFGEEKTVDLQADFASCADYLSQIADKLKRQGEDMKNVYLRYDGENPLPESLRGIQRLRGPFAPVDAKVLYLEEEHVAQAVEAPLSDTALAELHLVTPATQAERDAYDEAMFLRHPSLFARVFALPVRG